MNTRQLIRTILMVFIVTVVSVFASPVAALGDDDRFTIAQLQYSSTAWNPRPTAVRRLLLEVEKRTSIVVHPSTPAVKATSSEIFEYPMLFMSGDSAFEPFSEAAVANLRKFVQAGGLLIIDSNEGVMDGPFSQAVQRELRRILPDKRLTTIPRDHVLYKSFYLLDEPFGRIRASRSAQAIFDDDRLAIIVIPNDLLGALARDNFGNWEYSVTPNGERQREMAFRFGINLVMYALTINYKADQVHIPFILKRRQWRVD